MAPKKPTPFPYRIADGKYRPFVPDWLLDGLLANRGSLLLYGLGDAGKSSLVEAAITDVHKSGKFLGKEPDGRFGSVAVFTEKPRSEVRIPKDSGIVVSFTEAGVQQDIDDQLDRMTATMEAANSELTKPIGVVVVDPLATFFPAVIADHKDYGIKPLLDKIIRWQRKRRVALIAVHHTPKTNDTFAGAEAFAATFGVKAHLSAETGGVTEKTLAVYGKGIGSRHTPIKRHLTIDLERAGAKITESDIRLDVDSVKVPRLGAAILSFLAELPDSEHATINQIHDAVGGTYDGVRKWLKRKPGRVRTGPKSGREVTYRAR